MLFEFLETQTQHLPPSRDESSRCAQQHQKSDDRRYDVPKRSSDRHVFRSEESSSGTVHSPYVHHHVHSTHTHTAHVGDQEGAARD